MANTNSFGPFNGVGRVETERALIASFDGNSAPEPKSDVFSLPGHIAISAAEAAALLDQTENLPLGNPVEQDHAAFTGFSIFEPRG
jgi:hypothetical protein